MCALALILLAGATEADAATLTPSANETDFRAAIGAPSTVETWDTRAAGTRITNQVPGIVFSSPNASLRNYIPIQVVVSSGADSAPNVLAGGNVRSTGTPPQIMLLDLTASTRALAFYLTDQDPTATGVEAQFDLQDGTSRTFSISNTHTSQDSPIFFGVTSDTPILRVTLTAGFKQGGKGGYEAFSIDNLMLGLVCTADTQAPLCTGQPVSQGGALVISGNATDDRTCDSGIAGVTLATGAVNVTLTPGAGFTPGDPSAGFTAAQIDANLDGRGTVVVSDGAGHTCTVPVCFRSVLAGPTDGQVLCCGDGFLFQVSNDNPTPAGTSACSAALPSPSDPAYPPGYVPSPPDDPFPCRVLTIESPIAGLTDMVYKKDGTFDPQLRMLFSRSEDGGATFPPFRDVTESVEPILNIDPDPTRVKGTAQWSPVKVACALQGAVDCSTIDPTFDFDQDGYPLCPAAASGILADCNDQIFSIHPGAPETCNGLDDDCDGLIDEGDPGGGAACPLADRTGSCSAGSTVCVDGRLDCRQTVFPAPEICDGIDNDCDGLVDESWTFGGYLPPVEQDGSGVYHRKQTIPFKFQLTDCGGQLVPGVFATIEVLFYADGVIGTKVKDITSAGQANTDSIYRYDSSGHQYIYNLSTLALSINTTYLVRTHLGDGTVHDVLISIIK